jgi:hypothetical protein
MLSEKTPFYKSTGTRGPQWVPANKMAERVPEILEVKTATQDVSDFLSREFLRNGTGIERRSFTGDFFGRGRRPQFEYNVASVRRHVRQIKADRR